MREPGSAVRAPASFPRSPGARPPDRLCSAGAGPGGGMRGCAGGAPGEAAGPRELQEPPLVADRPRCSSGQRSCNLRDKQVRRPQAAPRLRGAPAALATRPGGAKLSWASSPPGLRSSVELRSREVESRFGAFPRNELAPLALPMALLGEGARARAGVRVWEPRPGGRRPREGTTAGCAPAAGVRCPGNRPLSSVVSAPASLLRAQSLRRFPTPRG